MKGQITGQKKKNPIKIPKTIDIEITQDPLLNRVHILQIARSILAQRTITLPSAMYHDKFLYDLFKNQSTALHHTYFQRIPPKQTIRYPLNHHHHHRKRALWNEHRNRRGKSHQTGAKNKSLGHCLR